MTKEGSATAWHGDVSGRSYTKPEALAKMGSDPQFADTVARSSKH